MSQPGNTRDPKLQPTTCYSPNGPGTPIPPFITVLTGITQQMLVKAPTMASVLPAFLEFARGCVLGRA